MRAKKRYGQNFLRSEQIAKRIVNSLKIEKNDIIIEIGPGLGALTKYLYKNPGYVGIEVDEELVLKLKSIFENADIRNEDFLKLDLKDFGEKAKYIGNLPYYIVSPIIFKIVENNFSEAVFMVQKEVAERMTADPGSRKYGFLTAMLKYYCDIEFLFTVRNVNFIPVPKVDSAVVRFKRNDREYEKKFVEFLKKCFSMKRKTLVNNLKTVYKADLIKEKLKFLNISLKSRAEELLPEELRRVYNALG